MRADKMLGWMIVDVIVVGAIAITLNYCGFANVVLGIVAIGSVGILALCVMGIIGEHRGINKKNG